MIPPGHAPAVLDTKVYSERAPIPSKPFDLMGLNSSFTARQCGHT